MNIFIKTVKSHQNYIKSFFKFKRFSFLISSENATKFYDAEGNINETVVIEEIEKFKAESANSTVQNNPTAPNNGFQLPPLLQWLWNRLTSIRSTTRRPRPSRRPSRSTTTTTLSSTSTEAPATSTSTETQTSTISSELTPTSSISSASSTASSSSTTSTTAASSSSTTTVEETTTDFIETTTDEESTTVEETTVEEEIITETPPENDEEDYDISNELSRVLR